MASLDTFFLCFVGLQAWLYSSLALKFYKIVLINCSYKIVLTKKGVYKTSIYTLTLFRFFGAP